MSNVGQYNMHEPCKPWFVLHAALAVRAERGSGSIAGCAPFGLQRTAVAPRSIHAGIARRVQTPAAVVCVLQATLGLFATFGSASRFCLASPRKPNPAFERTGQRPAAQGQR